MAAGAFLEAYTWVKMTHAQLGPSEFDVVCEGQQHFIIEFDSLFLALIHESKLLNIEVPQFLHLVYLLESKLNLFLSRGTSLEVVVFSTHQHHIRNWRSDFGVLRDLLLLHLRHSIKVKDSSLPLIPVHDFTTFVSAEWTTFLQNAKPFFILVSAKDINEDAPLSQLHLGFCHVMLALSILEEGFSVAYSDEIKHKGDSLVCSTLIPSYVWDREKFATLRNDFASILSYTEAPDAATATIHTVEELLISVLKYMIAAGTSDSVIKLLLLHTELLKLIPLRARSFALTSEGSQFIADTRSTFFTALREALDSFRPESNIASYALVDLFDFRFFLILAAFAKHFGDFVDVNDLGVTSDLASRINSIWSSVSATSFFPISTSTLPSVPLPTSSDVPAPLDVHVLPVKDALVKQAIALFSGETDLPIVDEQLAETPDNELLSRLPRNQKARNHFLSNPLIRLSIKTDSAQSQSDNVNVNPIQWTPEQLKEFLLKNKANPLDVQALIDKKITPAAFMSKKRLSDDYLMSSGFNARDPQTLLFISKRLQRAYKRRYTTTQRYADHMEKVAASLDVASDEFGVLTNPATATKAAPKEKESVLKAKQRAMEAQQLKNQKALRKEWDDFVKNETQIEWNKSVFDKYIKRAKEENLPSLGLEIALHILEMRFQAFKQRLTANEQIVPEHRAEIFNSSHRAFDDYRSVIAAEQVTKLATILATVGFLDSALKMISDDTKLTRQKKESATLREQFEASQMSTAIQFQLEHMGHLLRRAEFTPDPRVKFVPDPWQAELLNKIDKGESALVVAPTSSGKTFISFYCIRTVLERSLEDVVVYVSPTKALVNQMSAEVYGRFKARNEHYANAKMTGKSIYGVMLSDYRHCPTNCQVLITVPEMLEVMFFTPKYAEWRTKVKYIIFDEIHCIGGEKGLVWERLLKMIECPFLALSATISNKASFGAWLNHNQEVVREHMARQRLEFPERFTSDEDPSIAAPDPSTKGKQKGKKGKEKKVSQNTFKKAQAEAEKVVRRNEFRCYVIPDQTQKVHRFSDLRKQVIAPADELLYPVFDTVWPDATPDLSDMLIDVHPCSGLSAHDLLKGFPDVSFEPRDVLSLYNRISTFVTELKPEFTDSQNKSLQSLHPDSYFTKSRFITRDDVRTWEGELKTFLVTLARENQHDLVDKVLQSLSLPKNMRGLSPVDLVRAMKENDGQARDLDEEVVLPASSTVEGGATNRPPAGVKYNPRGTKSVDKLFDLLIALNTKDEATNRLPAIVFALDEMLCWNWAHRLARRLDLIQEKKRKAQKFDAKERAQQKQAKLQKKMYEAASKEQKDIMDHSEPIITEGAEIDEELSFCGWGQTMDFEDKDIKRLPEEFLSLLKRGIGIHHAALPRKLRAAVESGFRSGALRVVFATSTLALGIHMPCKTVIFARDEISLTPIQYQQMSGRAGRRGFDNIGRVMFFNIPTYRVQRLVSADIPHLKGSFPVEGSLIMRQSTMRALASDPLEALRIEQAAERVLDHPLYLVGSDGNSVQLQFHYRFYYELLVRLGLLGHNGQPIALSAFANQIHWTDPSNLLFSYLLNEGGFSEILNQAPVRAEENNESNATYASWIKKSLLFIFQHIFERHSVHPFLQRYCDREMVNPTRSRIVLEPLQSQFPKLYELIVKFNDIIFQTYLRYLVVISRALKLKENDSLLPLSNICYSSTTPQLSGPFGELLGKVNISTEFASPFVAITGCGDQVNTIQKLSEVISAAIEIELDCIPIINQDVILNSFALDYYEQGKLRDIETGNKLKTNAWEYIRRIEVVLVAVADAIKTWSEVREATKAESDAAAQARNERETVIDQPEEDDDDEGANNSEGEGLFGDDWDAESEEEVADVAEVDAVSSPAATPSRQLRPRLEASLLAHGAELLSELRAEFSGIFRADKGKK